MNKKNKYNFKKNFVNIFGFLGYLACSLQWLWAILLYYSLINKLALLMSANSESSQVSVSPMIIIPNMVTQSDSGPNFFVILVSFVVLVLMLALMVYVLIKIPSTIVKTGKNIVHETAEKAVPLVLQVQHKKETKRNRIKVTPKLIIAFKLLLVIIPVVLTFASNSVDDKSIGFDIALYLGLFLAVVCLITFAIQYALGVLLKIKLRELI